MVLGPVATDPELLTEGLSRAQYDALVEAGHLQDEPVELLEGVLVRMSPQGVDHARAVDRIATAVMLRLYLDRGEAYRVRQEKPFAASNDSEPEPDIAIVDAADDTWGSGHPSSAHLVIEVADTSRRVDLVHKPRIYAHSGVPEYWVVDLPRRVVVRHVHPTDTDRRAYEVVEDVSFTQPLSILGIEVTLADLLR
jgi:Uma2 family endonuclease